MPGHTCIVCGNNPNQDVGASFHRFPSEKTRRQRWLEAFKLDESQLRPQSRVCSRHFPNGDSKKDPLVTLGKRFASPVKPKHPRTKRAKARYDAKQLAELKRSVSPALSQSSRSITPSESVLSLDSQVKAFTASVGEQLETDYYVHELPSDSGDGECDTGSASASLLKEPSDDTAEVTVRTALLARIEVLEAENHSLRSNVASPQQHFRIEQIEHDDSLIRFYTGFPSYRVFAEFYEFLGPVVNELNYWGTKGRSRKRRSSFKLDPKNQFFLTLIRLRLNLKVQDLAVRFGISKTSVSRYVTTWICFLYHELKEIPWMPSVDQVMSTMPHSFKDKFPLTFAIIDASEIFIQTPSDLQMQSSTWSQYKHHNTAKFLVACTPNGAISFVSQVFVGSISDIELTRASGFLTTLEDKPGISIMADRGFTIKDMLKRLNIELNLPPFLEGKRQLPYEQVQEGRKIASLRIHVERAIGRLKNFAILKETIPITLSRLTNQIVHVCAFLSNFHPALVPLPQHISDEDVDDYINTLDDADYSDSDFSEDN